MSVSQIRPMGHRFVTLWLISYVTFFPNGPSFSSVGLGCSRRFQAAYLRDNGQAP